MENSSSGNSRGHVPAYGGPTNPMPQALGNVLTYPHANSPSQPIPALAPQPAALPPREAITPSGPAPPSGPQPAPLQPPAPLRPPERQQRRKALGDSISEFPEVSADLEGVWNGSEPYQYKVSRFKETTMGVRIQIKGSSVTSTKTLLDLSFRNAGGKHCRAQGLPLLEEF